jgi:hypothetical protein
MHGRRKGTHVDMCGYNSLSCTWCVAVWFIILFKPNNTSVISMYNYHPIMSNEKMNNHTHTQYTSILRGNPKREKTMK